MRGIKAGAGLGFLQPLNRGLAQGAPILSPFPLLTCLKAQLPTAWGNAPGRLGQSQGLGDLVVSCPPICVCQATPLNLRGNGEVRGPTKGLSCGSGVWGRRAEAKF